MAMGDIAFNLLIFFFILARASDDSHLQWTAAKADDLKNAGSPVASIVVDKNNELYLNGQQISISQLEGKLNELLSGMPQNLRQVHLKVHRTTQASRYEPIFEAIGNVGATMVHILDKKKE